MREEVTVADLMGKFLHVLEKKIRREIKNGQVYRVEPAIAARALFGMYILHLFGPPKPKGDGLMAVGLSQEEAISAMYSLWETGIKRAQEGQAGLEVFAQLAADRDQSDHSGR